MKLLIIAISMLFLFGCAGSGALRTLPAWNPEWSDGCSHASDLNNPEIRKCCVAHDEEYYYGGSYSDRDYADARFWRCLIDARMDLPLAWAYHEMVQNFGGPGWREPGVSWAFGGNYFRYSKHPAQPEEKKP